MFDQEKPFYQKEWVSSTLWSVGIHFVFLLAAFFIHFHDFIDKPNKELLEFRLNKVQSNPASAEKGSGDNSGSPGPGPEAVRFSQKKPSEGLKALSAQRRFVEEKSDTEMLQQEPMENTLVPAASSSRNLDTIIFENEKEKSSKKFQIKQTSISDYYQKDAEKSIKAVSPSGEGLMRSLSKSLGKVQWDSPGNMAVDPEEGMPGFTPTSGSGGSGNGTGHGFGTGSGEGLGLGEGIGGSGRGSSKYEALDTFMDIEVVTYQDPSDNQKYFRIKIFPKKDSNAFHVMPKELLFAIDCSLSISKDRLEEFKKGISFCLAHLNSGDLFNIIAFKDEAVLFSPESIPATPESVKRAERFVMDLTPSKQTDVYGAINRIVKMPQTREPSDIMLLSDGRPTYGVVDARELLNAITRVNQKVRPVFAYSGGAKVNRYLLDFISYQNRGWSEYIKNRGDISRGLKEFYAKIKDPIFLHLKYRLNGLDEKEIYPKSLPDFYANAEFTLYGSYAKEDEFSMQLLGDIDGKTKELIFSRVLSQAKKGTADVMKGYAFNKIYYLINRVTIEGNRPELLQEIQELSRRYGIQTPYSPELQKLD